MFKEISKKEFEVLFKNYNDLQADYKTLKELFEQEEQNSILANKCIELAIKKLSEIQLKHIKHNERGAGRKSAFTEKRLQRVQQLHKQGLSCEAIAKKVRLSKTYVYYLITKQKNKEDIEKINEVISILYKIK